MTSVGQSWTKDEIELLDMLLMNEVPISSASSFLQRSHTATKHAIKNIVYQGLLSHTPEEIAHRYHKDVEWVTKHIVDPKYSINYDLCGECECDCCSRDGACHDDEEDSVNSHPQNSDVPDDYILHSVLAGMMGVFGALVASGAFYYGGLLASNWK